MYITQPKSYWQKIVRLKKQLVGSFIIDIQGDMSELFNTQKISGKYDILQDVKIRTRKHLGVHVIFIGKYKTYGFNIDTGGKATNHTIKDWIVFEAAGGVQFAIKSTLF